MKKDVVMEVNRLQKYTGYLVSLLFFSFVFVFFAFFYNNHLHFEEQTQLFLLNGDYFLSALKLPGGISGWIGGFLTQFYNISLAGPIIITILLFLVQQVIWKILKSVNANRSFYILSFLPSLNALLILCDEFYPLSAVVGFLAALVTASMYVSLRNSARRFISGIILIILTYWAAGGSFMMLLSVMLVFEVLSAIKAGKEKMEEGKSFRMIKIWQLGAYLIIALGIPLLVRQFLILQPIGLTFMSEFYYDLRTFVPKAITFLFALPVILMVLIFILPIKLNRPAIAYTLQFVALVAFSIFGLKLWANFSAEEIMTYDYLVRNNRWNEVIAYADKTPPRNNLSLAMLNLSLAKTNKMGDRMFNFQQNGVNGLFLPFAKEYVAPMMGSEIFFQLGLVNASQEYSFESMETTPNLSKTVRSVKRLAETNLINGNYEVAGKYLRILEKTIFYRKWAKDSKKYLYNEKKINDHPVWGEKRRWMIKKDFFFKVQNMESTLNMLMREDKSNKMAFQYLMAFYMINKDLRNFMNALPLMEKMNYSKIPVSYQEAIMYIAGLSGKDLMQNIPFRISDETRARMKAYADIYTTRPNAKELLKTKFSGTYWYYLHYQTIDLGNEKKQVGK
jgi:hypothetical protein